MGFILIGIILGLVLFWISGKCKNDEFMNMFIYLSVIAVVVGIYGGLTIPTKYKAKEETKTVDLINLSDEVSVNGEKQLFYVIISPTNTYTYYTPIESEFAEEKSKAYISNTISEENNVTIVEEEECLNPRLVIYVEKAKITFWSFGIGKERTYYVFYVPQNTLIHNFELE